MLERIIAGIVIGAFAGLFFGKKFSIKENTKSIITGFIGVVVIAFVGSSFMFGAIYGFMAIGEVSIGYWLSVSLLVHKDT